MGLAGVMRRGGPVALLLILVPGLWMAADRWKFPPWTTVALVSLIVIAGSAWWSRALRCDASGRASVRLRASGRRTLPRPCSIPMLVRSLALRLGIALGVVALMVFKPDLAVNLVVVLAGAIIGLLVSMAT